MKNNSIDILKKIECTGCSVCKKICPHNAIEMIETKEGFHYPLIDENKCTNCGLCVKKCHALNDNFKTDFNQEIYDVRANDDIRMKSSSGGMFTILANYVLENNGYVCGASFTKDWFGVEHIIINDKKDLDKLRGSKYIESSLGNIFIEIKKLLIEEKQVLFSGCPCQVSALYSYLGKYYDNLITVDLLCNSIVPQKVWKKYLNELFTDEKIKNIEYISFRDKKKLGWTVGLYIEAKYDEYIATSKKDLYMSSFLQHISVKEECLHCKYRKFIRVSDITIGDYWGCDDIDDKGISLVFINTLHAKNIFNNLNTAFYMKKLESYNSVNGGHGGKYTNVPILASRKYFFDNLDKEDLKTLYKNSSNTKYNVGIVNMAFQDNYGGALTYHALYRAIEEFGYNPILIYNDKLWYAGNNNSIYDNANGHRFALSYANIYNEFFEDKQLNEINDLCDTFIVGSDEVWKYKTHTNNIYYFLLNFVSNDKKKIAFSSAFNLKRYDGNYYSYSLFNHYLHQLDYISVRDSESLNICKKDFFINNVEQTIDPVFIFDDYDYLTNKSKLKINFKYICVYIRTGSKDQDKYINYISDKLKLEVYKTGKVDYDRPYDLYDKNLSVEDWLYMIKNSEFVLTDSFHGTCFAIIFNKPFITICHDSSPARMLSILTPLGLENRMIDKFEYLIDNDLIYSKIEYDVVNSQLKKEKDRAKLWLENALKSSKQVEEKNYRDELINILINENKYLKSLLNTYKIEFEKEIYNINESLNNTANTIFDKISNNSLDNWIKLFGIYNDINYIYLYLFGIKFSIKATKSNIDKIAWWIPFKKQRESFRSKFKVRPDQTRPDQTRPDLIICKEYIQFYNNLKIEKLQPMLHLKNAA